MTPIKWIVYKSPEAGAQTQIMLSLEPELENVTGKYFTDCAEKEPSAKTKDEELGEWLWVKSQEMTGLEVVGN